MKPVVAILALLLAAGPALAADAPEPANVRGESTSSRKRLAEVERKLLAGKAAEATDELQRILDEVGDSLVTADGTQFRAARLYVHQFLAKLPDAELKKYRDRVEEPAARLLAAGRDRREARPLLELLDRYALSRPAEDAILLLAEMAYERGEFATAERYWQKLLSDADGFRYPAVKTPGSLLRAKLVLAAHARGDRAAGKLFDEFRTAHAEAVGHLAGKDGNLVDILARVLAAPLQVTRPSAHTDWPTVGGSPSRDGRVPNTLPRHWPSQPTWKTRIPPAGPPQPVGGPPLAGPVKSLAFHPVILGDRAYIADAGRLVAFDLRSGAAEILVDPQHVLKPAVGREPLQLPVTTDTDYTLTAADGRLYFRFGPADLFPAPAEVEAPITKPSALVCFAPPGRVEWTRLPPVPADVPASWEGSPLVADGHVLAAFVRSEGGRAVQAIACYRGDADRPLWVTDVSETATAAGRTRPELLTLAGRNVVFCSHTGVVAAVNAYTGKPAWAYRYPRVRRLLADGRHRDLCPPVAADGRVFVAPNDGDQLLAFDAESGRLLWQDGPLVFDHLVGAAAGKVVVTVSGPQRGVRAYDAATGACDPLAGWRNHDDPFLPNYGRGLMSDDLVAWPTASALYTMRLADGTVAAQPVRTPHGNLAYGRGVLVVATATEVLGYVQDGPDTPEPPRTRPPLLGKISPASQPDRSPPELPPRLGSPAVLEPVSAVSIRPAVNLGRVLREADGTRVVVRVGRETEIVRGNSITPYAGPRPTAVVADGGDLFFVSDTGLSRVDPADGHDVWTATEPGITDAIPIRGGVVVRVGTHHLVAYDRASGRPGWALDSQQRSRLPGPTVESGPQFRTVVGFENRLLVQLSTGRRWLLDAATGKVLDEADTADRPWPSRSFVVADGPDRVTRVDADGKELWRYDPGREGGTTGDAAGVRDLGDSVYVVVRRNFGVEIDRLSATTGVSRWPAGPAVVPTDGVDSERLVVDGDRLYAPFADRLAAFHLDTGRPAWQIELPHATTWQVVLTQNRLVVLPTHALLPHPAAALESFLRFPHLRRLVGLAHTAAADAVTGSVPVLVCDPATGRVEQRLSITAAGPAAVDVGRDGVAIAAGGTIYRLH